MDREEIYPEEDEDSQEEDSDSVQRIGKTFTPDLVMKFR